MVSHSTVLMAVSLPNGRSNHFGLPWRDMIETS
jgi:hypothetical protein